MTTMYGIAEWFGRPFARLTAARRRSLARSALGHAPPPLCPFQRGTPPCGKEGGVCSLQAGRNQPVITCPRRFDANDLLPNWLARIVGFTDVHVAREVPFMRSPSTGRPAGRIDLVVARDSNASAWFGLEIQAVYFSGAKMQTDFELLLSNTDELPPEPTARRRPDFRSSSAKRLMPQLRVKGPTLRRWSTKLAVAVDLPFFEAVGGPSDAPSQDLNDGDIVWLVPRIDENYKLVAHHWEVLSLEASSDKLLSARTVQRQEFENVLLSKLTQIGGGRKGRSTPS